MQPFDHQMHDTMAARKNPMTMLSRSTFFMWGHVGGIESSKMSGWNGAWNGYVNVDRVDKETDRLLFSFANCFNDCSSSKNSGREYFVDSTEDNAVKKTSLSLSLRDISFLPASSAESKRVFRGMAAQ